MQRLNFDEVLQRILGQDSRYRPEAYLFLREALDHTQKRLNTGKKDEPHHVTGQELLTGFREYALTQFGPMAKAVLNEWGVASSEDVGEMVFNMVDHGLLSKTEDDRREDFKAGFDFDEAFCRPFRPKSASATAPPTTKAEQA